MSTELKGGARIEDDSHARPKKRAPRPRRELFSEAEKRAARSERITVCEAFPFGWLAQSESREGSSYRVFCEPTSRLLVCDCADFTFRGGGEPGANCKHTIAVTRFIGAQYLSREYSARGQFERAGERAA